MTTKSGLRDGLLANFGQTVVTQEKAPEPDVPPPKHKCALHGPVYAVTFSHEVEGTTVKFGPFCFICWAMKQADDLPIVEKIPEDLE